MINIKHNHITRDIKPLGECPSCDEHHYKNIIKTATPQELLQNEAVRELVEAGMETKGQFQRTFGNGSSGSFDEPREMLVKALKKFEVLGNGK